MTITYRKTKDGEWVAYGPASEIKPDTQITVTRRDGKTKTEFVTSIGRPFAVNGQRMVYGHLAIETPNFAPTVCLAGCTSGCNACLGEIPPIPTGTSKRQARMCDECGTRQATVDAVDLSGIPGRVCSRCKCDEGTLSFA